LKKIPTTYPMLFGASFTCFKTISADLFTQTVILGRDTEDINWQRTSVFGVFGFFYMGLVNYVILVKIMAERLFPNAKVYAAKSIREKLKDGPGTRALCAQVFLDTCVHLPFLFYPCYYMTKGAMLPRAVGHEDQPLIEYAHYKWKTNFWGDLKSSLMIWVPADLVNFGFMPMHLRVPFMACMSFGFCMVLSLTRGGKPALSKEAAEAGKRLQDEIGHVDPKDLSELAQEMLLAIKLNPDDVTDHVTLAQFQAFCSEKLGIKDPSLAKFIFEVCDRDNDGFVTGPELSTVLMTSMSAKTSVEDRMGFIFDSVDLDKSGFLDYDEIIEVVFSMLKLREALFTPGQIESDVTDSIAGASGGYAKAVQAQINAANTEAEKVFLREKQRKIHLMELKNRHKVFRKRNDVKLEEVLKYEASKMAHKMMFEGDVGVHDDKISRDEFMAWTSTKSKTSKKLVDLFTAFMPTLHH